MKNTQKEVINKMLMYVLIFLNNNQNLEEKKTN